MIWLNVVGLTPRLLAHAPRLRELAARGGTRPLAGVTPAVTCTAQATALTGTSPQEHGIVANGWYRRELGEVRFWVQANQQIESETIYAAASRRAAERGERFTCAKLFWWFNQGAPVDWSVTPKPWYGADGSKIFGIHGSPPEFPGELEQTLGTFPFFTFWGPNAGLPATDWIAASAARVIRQHRPSLSLVYLPHLDYDLQRFGPDADVTALRVAEIDRAAGQVLNAAKEVDADVLAFSEYGIVPVRAAVFPNRVLREAGLLAVRDGPFGELIDYTESRAFAVCDHQLAHVYVKHASETGQIAEKLAAVDGVAGAFAGSERGQLGLDHLRSGEVVLLSEADHWFAYPYWLDDLRAPDFARTVDIHRKPGYDPLELFVDADLRFPKLRVARRLAQKFAGMRYLMDVVGFDTARIRGSHGVEPTSPDDGPVLVSNVPGAADAITALTDLKDFSLARLGLG